MGLLGGSAKTGERSALSRLRRRLLLIALSFPVFILVVAFFYSIGMQELEGRPRDFWASISWAAETLTTTGYGHDNGWSHPIMVLYVMVVQFVGVIWVFLVLPILLLPILEDRFEARLPTKVDKLEGHVVLYRYGAAVTTLLEELETAEVPALVIEDSPVEARRILDRKIPLLYRRFDDGALAAAHLLTARALIVNGSDEENAAVTLAAREMGFKGDILALVEQPLHRQPMTLAGATSVITPRHVLAASLASRACSRVSTRVVGVQVLGAELEVSEFRIQPSSQLAGKTLAQADVGAQTGSVVIGQWVAGKLMTQPSASMTIEPRGILVAVGAREDLTRLATLAGHAGSTRTGPIVVAGYGEVGKKVVEVLTDVGQKVVVIDRNPGPGVDLAGDSLDEEILVRAGVAEASSVVLALDSDASTLFATVILRNLSPEVPVVARVNRAQNVQRIHQAGADFAISISQVAGQILAHRILGEEMVSVHPSLRLQRVTSSALDGRHAADAEIRRRTGCSVVAVERGGLVNTQLGGEFCFENGDAIYICGDRAATRRFTEVFA